MTQELKSISFPSEGIVCRCNKATFIIRTPNGGEYNTCPLCDHGDNDIDYPNIDDIKDYYCTKCKIIYNTSHCHMV
jgi:O-succinylbenzoate synthase